MKTSTEILKENGDFINREFGSLVGKTVKKVRLLTETELELFGWDDGYGECAFLVEFSDGTVIVPSQDPEGNGAGFLFIEKVG